MKNIVGSPFPPIDNDLLRMVADIGSKILSAIFGETTKEISKTDSISTNESIENVDKVITAFANYKEQIKIAADKIEKSVIKEVDSYIEELKIILDENKEVKKKYGINVKRIERQINKISSNISNYIDIQISKKVSLDNAECKAIISMPAGTRKENETDKFLKETMAEILDKYCMEVHKMLSEIFEDTEDELLGLIEEIQKINEGMLQKIKDIDIDNCDEKAGLTVEQAVMTMSVSDLVIYVMRE